MVGRTHGMHAEPITFGLKLLNWYSEMERDLKRLQEAKEIISYGKISGSVGTYAHLGPQIEKEALHRLGLKPARISNQIIQRDRHAQVFSALAILGSGLERIAVEIRHLQRTEVAEVKEKKSHGSSSMPHKENPITSETTTGQARILRSNLQAGLENIALWHERDISHSSVERIIIPDGFILADYMLQRMATLIKELIVYPEKMKENLEITKGIVFSQGLLLKMVDKGLSRKEAHELIRENALKAWEKRTSVKDLMIEDERVTQYLPPEEIDKAFDMGYWTKYVDSIYKRFGFD
jgi:adenylosuccinate lyase